MIKGDQASGSHVYYICYMSPPSMIDLSYLVISRGDHTETVDLEFDPSVVSYEELLNKFWKSHNPCSQRGTQYMSAIFYHGTKQKMLAEQTREEQQKNHVSPIVTKIIQAGPFYNAEK